MKLTTDGMTALITEDIKDYTISIVKQNNEYMIILKQGIDFKSSAKYSELDNVQALYKETKEWILSKPKLTA